MANEDEKPESKSKLQQTLNGYGGNIKPVMDQLKADRDKVIALQAKRDDINAQINEVRAGVKAMGISKKAFDSGVARSQMDPEKRAELDDNYAIVCEALGVPLQQEFKFGNNSEKDNEDANTEDENIGQQQAEAIQAAAANG